MVGVFRKKDGKINLKVISSFSFVILLTILANWMMISYMFSETIQEILYPYSGYPIIVYSVGEVLTFPGWAVLCLTTILIINHILFELFKKSLFVKIKARLQQAVAFILVISVILIIAEFIGWPLAAKKNGYYQCPKNTLLLGYKASTAWAKNISLCYDAEIKERLPTGTLKQVKQTAQYLENRK